MTKYLKTYFGNSFYLYPILGNDKFIKHLISAAEKLESYNLEIIEFTNMEEIALLEMLNNSGTIKI